MTPSERELLLRVAHVSLTYMTSAPYPSNALETQSFHELLERVIQETHSPKGTPELPARAEQWLREHLDQRYEVKNLNTYVGADGTIFVESAMLIPRDEL